MPVIFLLALSLTASSCKTLMEILGYQFVEPEISVQSIEIQSMRIGVLKVDVRMLVKNPNDFDIKLTKLTYDMSVGDTQIAQGAMPQPLLKIPASRATEVKLPIVINPEATLAVFAKLLDPTSGEKNSGQAPKVLLRADLQFDTPIGKISHHHEGEHDLKRIGL